MSDYKIKRKEKALRNATKRIANCEDRTSARLLQKRMKEADIYLKKLREKNKGGWFK